MTTIQKINLLNDNDFETINASIISKVHFLIIEVHSFTVTFIIINAIKYRGRIRKT